MRKVTITLILTNIVLFIYTIYIEYTLKLGDYLYNEVRGNIYDFSLSALVYSGAVYDRMLLNGEYFRFVTTNFLHGDLFHIISNMIGLIVFGIIVEKQLGPIRYLVLYILAGIITSIIGFAIDNSISIGASAAVYSLIGFTVIYSYVYMRKTYLIISLVSIFVGIFTYFTAEDADNLSHLLGLFIGIIYALIIYRNKKYKVWISALL